MSTLDKTFSHTLELLQHELDRLLRSASVDAQDLNKMRDRIMKAVASASSLDELEDCQVAALGKRGTITALLTTLGKMTPAERLVQGPIIQGIREAVVNGVAERKAALLPHRNRATLRTTISIYSTPELYLALKLSKEFDLKFGVGECSAPFLGSMDCYIFHNLDSDLSPLQQLIFKDIVEEYEKGGAA